MCNNNDNNKPYVTKLYGRNMGCTPCKILWIIHEDVDRRTSTNRTEYKKTKDDE